MNIQAIMKQAQEMQKKMMKDQEEIEKLTFTATSGNVEVELGGNGIFKKVKINNEEEKIDDIEMIEDMFLVAANEAITNLNKTKEAKMGAHAKNMPGIF